MKVRVLINSVDVTGSLLEQEWTLTRSDGGEISTIEASFLETGTVLAIQEDHDFIVEDWDDATNRLFGGIVVNIVDTPQGLDRHLRVLAQDWKLIVERSTFSSSPLNLTDKVIIQNAFTLAGVTEIDTNTLVSTARTIQQLTFRGATLRQMLDTISDITGYIWDINPFKKLIYRPETQVWASFSLSDNPDEVTSFPYYNFIREKELGAYNAIEVKGARRLSSNVTVTTSGNGTQTIFHLAQVQETVLATKKTEMITFPPEGGSQVTVDKNTGTDGVPVWTAQTVGLEGDSGKDVIWSPATNRLEFAVAPANLTKSWRITGRYYGYATAIAIAPGAIRTYTKVLTEDSVDTDEAAQDLADAFLREVGNKDRLVLDINRDGLVPGTSIYVNNSKRWTGAKRYKVHEVITRLLGTETFEYKVTLGAGSHSFAHIISELRQKAGRLPVYEGEAVTHIRRFGYTTEDTKWLGIQLNNHAGVSRSGPYLVTNPGDAPGNFPYTFPIYWATDLDSFIDFDKLEARLALSFSYVGYATVT